MTQPVSPFVVMGEKYNVEPTKLLGILKATCVKAKNRSATNEEVAAFVIVANQYGLSPFTREIYAFAGKGGDIVPIVGVDGWATLVNRHPDFDGCNFLEHLDRDGRLESISCTMHAKSRRHPVQVTEWLAECRRDTEPWRTMPRRMLRHKAFIQAARYCFGLTGIYDEDEATDIVERPTLAASRPVTTLPAEPQAPIPDPLMDGVTGNGQQASPPAEFDIPDQPPDSRQDEMAQDDAMHELIERARRCVTALELEALAGDLADKRTWLGESRAGEVEKVLQEIRAEMDRPRKTAKASK